MERPQQPIVMSRAIVTQLRGISDIPQILVLLHNIHTALVESNTKNVEILCLIPSSRIDELRAMVEPLFSELIVLVEDISRLDCLFLQLESLYTRYDTILFINSSMFPTIPSCLLDLFENIKENQILASANPAWPDIFSSSVFSIKPNFTDYQTIQKYSQFENSFSTSNLDFICYVLEHLEWINLPYLYNTTATQNHEKCSYQYLPATQRFFQDVKMVNFENEKPWKILSNSTNYRYSRQWYDCWIKLFPHLLTIDVDNTLALESCVGYFKSYIDQENKKSKETKLENLKKDSIIIPDTFEKNSDSEKELETGVTENDSAIHECHNGPKFDDSKNVKDKQDENNINLSEVIDSLTLVAYAPPITLEDLQNSYAFDSGTDLSSKVKSQVDTQNFDEVNNKKIFEAYDIDNKVEQPSEDRESKEEPYTASHYLQDEQETIKKAEEITHDENVISNEIDKTDINKNLTNDCEKVSETPIWNYHQDKVYPERVFPTSIDQKDLTIGESKDDLQEVSEPKDNSSKEIEAEEKGTFFVDDRPYIPRSVVPERVFMDDPVAPVVSEEIISSSVGDPKKNVTDKDELRNRVMSFFTSPSTYSAFKTVDDYQSWNPTIQDPKDLQHGKGEAQLLTYSTESCNLPRDTDINKKQNERILSLFTTSLENDFQQISSKKIPGDESTNFPVDGLITPVSATTVLNSLSSLSVNSTSSPCSPEISSSPNLSELDANFDFSLHPWSKDKKYLKYLKQGYKYKNLYSNQKVERKKNQKNFEAPKKPLKSILKKPNSKKS